jgi:hypothetical protein
VRLIKSSQVHGEGEKAQKGVQLFLLCSVYTAYRFSKISFKDSGTGSNETNTSFQFDLHNQPFPFLAVPYYAAVSRLVLCSNEKSCLVLRRLEKYLSALGQSPEGFALMKTDPLRLGSKVSKIE